MSEKNENIEDLKVQLEGEQNDHKETAVKLAAADKKIEVLNNEVLQVNNKASKFKTAATKSKNELTKIKAELKANAKKEAPAKKAKATAKGKPVFVTVSGVKYKVNPKFRYLQTEYTAKEAAADKDLINDLIECKSFVLTKV